MAQLAKARLREKIPEIEQSLRGQFGPHQRFLLAYQLAHVDFLDETIARLDAEVKERMRPFEDAIARLDEIPSVGRRTAEVIIAEVGTDCSLPILLRVDDPYVSFLKVLVTFHPPKDPLPPGIHPTAVIARTAKLGTDVRVGAHVVIGEECVIGTRP